MRQDQPIQPIAVSINQACVMLGLSRFTLSRLLSTEVIRSRRVGRRVLIPTESLHDFLGMRS